MNRVRHLLTNTLAFLLNNSLFLIAGAALALGWANLDNSGYEAFIHGAATHVAPGQESAEAGHASGVTFHFIVNDVLMCFFFAIAAKEIWEALLPGGALSSPKKAATPLLATLGGVVGPAFLYIGGTHLFARPDLARGWAIPCATDIAFSYLVARLVFGSRHPAIPFLLLLAIADDAVGLVILAVFYPSGELQLPLFVGCVGAALAINLVLRRFRVTSFWAYLVIAGPIAWYGFFRGGVHPALALVPLIPTLPHEPRDAGLFAEDGLEEAQRPHDALNEFEHWWKNPVELILLAFGLANAGVLLSNIGLPTALVSVGLLVGKPVGIVLLTLLSVKVLRLEMPVGMSLRDVVVLGVMAGIGFTVALFVAAVAFKPPAPAAVLDSAKMGALLSFFAAFLAFGAARALRVGRWVETVESVEAPAPPSDITESATPSDRDAGSRPTSQRPPLEQPRTLPT